MIIELEVEGVPLNKWAERQKMPAHPAASYKAADDLRRAVANAGERMLRDMGFADATVKWWHSD